MIQKDSKCKRTRLQGDKAPGPLQIHVTFSFFKLHNVERTQSTCGENEKNLEHCSLLAYVLASQPSELQ